MLESHMAIRDHENISIVYEIHGVSASVQLWNYRGDVCNQTSVFAYALLNLLQTDRAAMLDEIVDYVKFLRLQVKV